MAVAKFQKPPKPIKIENFLGLNESVGNTQIKLGEFSLLENFRITKNMKLQKREGHHVFINFGSGDVQGIWYGTIEGKNIMLVCWAGDVYEYDMDISTPTIDIADLITEGTVTIIGTITDVKTDIVWFAEKVYFLNGTDYKEYDGTTYQDVVGYIPTVALNSPPAGGGTLFEEVNLISGKKTQIFVGDGASTLYQLAESGLDADLLVITVDGAPKTEGVDFTVDRVLGQVTFTVAPINLASVSITWAKVTAGNADLVKNHKYMVDFGVNNDTNLFIFGNINEKNVFRFSGLLKANYFPANSFVGVASDEFAITDLIASQNSLLVYKENSTKLVAPTINPNYANNTGLNPYNYGYQDLNEKVGNLAPKMVQLIEDSPVSVDGFSMWLWGITEVETQRSAKIISDRIKLSLQVLNLRNSVTFNYSKQKEYWLNIDNIVYIWNYGNDTMYKYTNIQATKFVDIEGDIYYGSNGTVDHVNDNFLADGETLGDSIPCVGKLGFSDLDMLNLEKNMRDEWIAISPASRTSCTVIFVTDKVNEEESKQFLVEYILMDFNNIDFNDFSFLTNVNPQPKRFRGKIRKFTYLQTIFKNNTNDESLTVLKLLLPVKAHRYSG